MGSHDGFSLLERYLTSISFRIGVSICVAAGNESQAGHHTQGLITQEGEIQNIEIKVDDDSNDIYINMRNDASDRMSISVISPTGERVGRVPAKSGISIQANLTLERARVIIEYYLPVLGSGVQLTTIKIINATSGIWTIEVHGDIIIDGIYHAWLPITGFISPNISFLSPTPDYTMIVPSTGIGLISCGAYNSMNNSLYVNSSWGPSALPMLTLDLVAPGVNIQGIYPGGYGTMTGTSVSTAITAGAAALMMQWGILDEKDKTLNTYRIRAYLIRGCERDYNIKYPSIQWGYGRLNLLNTFIMLRDT